MGKLLTLFFIFISAPISVLAATSAGAGAEVYFISPADGETLKNPVQIRFGLKNMGVAPAGSTKANTGHHHLLIDTALPTLNTAIGKDDKHRHFGGGQTETSLELAPGQHTLQLLLGDFSHIPHEPAVYSKQITITVED